jgi:hypothetical protein
MLRRNVAAPERRSGAPFFATAANGTEGILRKELQELGIARVKATRGGVYFGGERDGGESSAELASALRVCLHSRIAVRVRAPGQLRGTRRRCALAWRLLAPWRFEHSSSKKR